MTLLLSNAWTFAQKELRSFFNSAVAYVILTLFLLIAGWFFASSLFLVNQADCAMCSRLSYR